MANKENIKIFTATDIENYHRGLLSSKERHALEKAALDDPMLADALEGYEAAHLNMEDDIADLKNRLAGKTVTTKIIPIVQGQKPAFSWWKVAAMIILIAGAGFLVYQLSFTKKTVGIAETPNKRLEKVVRNDSSPVRPNAVADTMALVTDNNQNESNKTITSGKPAADSSSGYKKDKDDREVAAALPEQKSTPVADEKRAELFVETETKNVDAAAPAQPTSKLPPNTRDKAIVAKSRRQPVDANAERLEDAAPVAAEASQGNLGNANAALLHKSNVFRGQVTDANNNPLPFTNITHLEDMVGTYTDARGYFILTSPDSLLTVQVRALGFETNNVQLVNTKKENKISLEEDKSLNAKILDTARRNINRTRHSTMALEEPEPVDGWGNYDTYLVNNLKVPESFRSRQNGGEVELAFEVDKNGQPVNITVKKSLCESCDKEAIRLIKQGPKWKRKIKKGKTTVTVTF